MKRMVMTIHGGDALPEMRTADEVIEDALYAELRALLEFCTEAQVNGLWRIYAHAPSGSFPLKIRELRSVLGLVRRTILINQTALNA